MEYSIVIKALTRIYHLTCWSMRSRFQESAAGVIWVLLNPTIMYLAHYYIFSQLFSLEGEEKNFYRKYLSIGFFPWVFFSISLEMGVSTFSYKLKSLKSLKIRESWFNYAGVLENAVVFLCLWTLWLGFELYLQNILWYQALLSYVTWILFIMFVCFCVNALAYINVRFRDLKFIIMFVMKVLFLITPIIYQVELLNHHSDFLSFNPLWIYLRSFHSNFSTIKIQGLGLVWIGPAVLTLIAFVVNKLVVVRIRRWIYHYER